jgi:hypothetical protein
MILKLELSSCQATNIIEIMQSWPHITHLSLEDITDLKDSLTVISGILPHIQSQTNKHDKFDNSPLGEKIAIFIADSNSEGQEMSKNAHPKFFP